MFKEMIENRYKKMYETQKKVNARQAEQIESLKVQIQNLEKKCKEKDELIDCIEPMKDELMQYVDGCKKTLEELRKMKAVANKKLYGGKWWIVRFLIK